MVKVGEKCACGHIQQEKGVSRAVDWGIHTIYAHKGVCNNPGCPVCNPSTTPWDLVFVAGLMCIAFILSLIYVFIQWEGL